MSVVFNKALNSIKALSNDEKALMAHCLISALETKQDENVEQTWAQLATERFEELKSGQVKAVSWDEIKKTVTA
jgi:putative addiction module component (TIGR02574 family)